MLKQRHTRQRLFLNLLCLCMQTSGRSERGLELCQAGSKAIPCRDKQACCPCRSTSKRSPAGQHFGRMSLHTWCMLFCIMLGTATDSTIVCCAITPPQQIGLNFVLSSRLNFCSTIACLLFPKSSMLELDFLINTCVLCLAYSCDLQASKKAVQPCTSICIAAYKWACRADTQESCKYL